jgi:hypothetical protein
MGRNLKLLCSLRKTPKPIRLLAAWLLIAAGFPLILIPLPGGVVLIGCGLFLLADTSPEFRAGIGRRLARVPWLARRMAPLLAVWDACPREGSRPGHGGLKAESARFKDRN